MKLRQPVSMVGENQDGGRDNSPVFTLLVVVQLVLDHADHDFVRDQLALVHDLLRLPSEVRLGGDLSAQHVARGQMAAAVLLLDLGGLGTLA